MSFLDYEVPEAKNNAIGQLLTPLGASGLSIQLESGQGARFPQPIKQVATSVGDSETMNCTSIGSSGLAVGDEVINYTDGSVAEVIEVSTNSIKTTLLQGGSDNTWQSSDVLYSKRFTYLIYREDENGNIQDGFENGIISERSGDILTIANIADRGIDGTVAVAWSNPLESVYIVNPVDKNYVNTLKKKMSNIAIRQRNPYYYAEATGSGNAFVASIDWTPQLLDGAEFRFKANHSITGSATLNINGFGAKTIKKNGGGADLENNDIQTNDTVQVFYNSSNDNFVMGSQIRSTNFTFASEDDVIGISNNITQSISPNLNNLAGRFYEGAIRSSYGFVNINSDEARFAVYLTALSYTIDRILNVNESYHYDSFSFFDSNCKISSLIKKGDYLYIYVLYYVSALSLYTPRVYRLDLTNIAGGATLMTTSGFTFANQSISGDYYRYRSMAFDGTYFYFNRDPETINSTIQNKILKCSYTGTTLTKVSTIQCGTASISICKNFDVDGTYIYSYGNYNTSSQVFNYSGTEQTSNHIWGFVDISSVIDDYVKVNYNNNLFTLYEKKLYPILKDF